jgi:hypothetical protein
MLGDLEHLGDDDAVERRRRRTQVLDLEAAHRQALGELGGRDRRIAELAQPGFGELHVGVRAGGSGELAEEAQVAVEEEAQVVDAVAQHREAVDPRAEGEADDRARDRSPCCAPTCGCTCPSPRPRASGRRAGRSRTSGRSRRSAR